MQTQPLVSVFIPYYNDEEFFKDQQLERAVFGTTKLYSYINDDEMREKIENKFGFGISDFRTLYSTDYEAKKKGLRHEINRLQPKKLSVFHLFYLLFRKLYRLLTLRFLKKLKQDAPYTV